MGDLEDIKKSFIIDDKESVEENLTTQVEKLTRFVKIGKTGKIYLQEEKLTASEKILLVVLARHLGHMLDDEIPAGISAVEIEKFTSLPPSKILMQLSDFKLEGLVQGAPNSEYCFNPQADIDAVLNLLDKKYPPPKKK
ncbi:MAG: hypothetical protein ACTSQY_02200 [Candidatus Odinarchaeia archaeon]